MLIDYGDGLNIAFDTVSGCSAIQMACYCGRFEAAEILFEAGADIFIKTTTYQERMLEALLQKPDLLARFIENDGNKELPILHAMCRANNYELLCEYIDKGYDVNGLNYFGVTPLFTAKDKKIIEKLYEESIDITIKGKSGVTALMMACISNNKNLFDKLISDPRCEVNCVKGDNQNALHIAIFHAVTILFLR